LSQVLTQYLNTPQDRLQSSQYGETNETLSSATLAVVSMVRAAVRLLTLCLSGLAYWLMLAVYSLELAFFASALVLVIGLVCVSFSLKEQRMVRALLSASSKNRDLLHVLITAIPTLRASGATRRLVDRWVELVRAQAVHAVRRDYVQLNRGVVIQFGQLVASWGATAWLIRQTLDGSISLGVLITATLLVGSLVRGGVGVVETLFGVYALQPHWERVNALLEQARHAPQREALGAEDVAHLQRHGLRLDGVSYRYDAAERWVLQDYTAHFPPGQHTVLRAASGSGKSTILRSLAGVTCPVAGQVTVFGRDPHACSGLVAYLPQQSMLLEASIATNLTTLSGAKVERALQVAEATGLAHMLETLPMGAETWVSAGGGNLSAGQRQLILLTAVFAGAAPVVLLDEATSQLDHASLSRIQWPVLCAGRTVVSVAHQ
jgi:ABC-type bacteriocin/lantibiotic exporter with double-glycine peptidase domain